MNDDATVITQMLTVLQGSWTLLYSGLLKEHRLLAQPLPLLEDCALNGREAIARNFSQWPSSQVKADL